MTHTIKRAHQIEPDKKVRNTSSIQPVSKCCFKSQHSESSATRQLYSTNANRNRHHHLPVKLAYCVPGGDEHTDTHSFTLWFRYGFYHWFVLCYFLLKMPMCLFVLLNVPWIVCGCELDFKNCSFLFVVSVVVNVMFVCVLVSAGIWKFLVYFEVLVLWI